MPQGKFALIWRKMMWEWAEEYEVWMEQNEARTRNLIFIDFDKNNFQLRYVYNKTKFNCVAYAPPVCHSLDGPSSGAGACMDDAVEDDKARPLATQESGR